MNRRIALPLLLLIIGSVYFYTAGSRAIYDDGDALYSHIAQQMTVNGEWVTPFANGVRFLDKPPMMYWTMGFAYRIFGFSEFAARFPSALAVLGIAIILYFMANRAAGSFAGFAAAMASALCIGTFLFTRMVFPDVLFLFFLTLAIYGFLEWYLDDKGQAFPALISYAATAGAVLTKGLIGLVFPVAIIILFLLWSGEWRKIFRFHIFKGSALFLALSLPWHILASSRNPGFLWYYFINEHALRFIGKRQPYDYVSISLPVFWGLVLVWLFPWSAFLPSLRHLCRNTAHRALEASATIRLALCWAAVIFVFFSFSSRIEHYSMPIFPPLALLVGIALCGKIVLDDFDDGEESRRRSLAKGFGFLAIIGGLMALLLISAMVLMSQISGQPLQEMTAGRLHAYQFYFAPLFEMPPEILRRLITPFVGTCIALAIGLPGAWWMNRRKSRVFATIVLSCTTAFFCLFAFQSMGICEEILSSKQFGMKLSQVAKPTDSKIIMGDFETANSMNFYTPGTLSVYEGSAALLQWGMTYPDAPEILLSRKRLEEKWQSSRRVFLLAPENRLESLKLHPIHIVMRSGGRALLCNQSLAN